MFWRKKTNYQRMVEKWDKVVKVKISDNTDHLAESLENTVIIIYQSAGMLYPETADKLAKKCMINLGVLFRGSLLIGYDFQKNTNARSCAISHIEDLPVEVRFTLEEIIKPVVEVVIRLIELSHSPGRIIIFEENKEGLKRDLVNKIYQVAMEYFKEGVNQGIRENTAAFVSMRGRGH